MKTYADAARRTERRDARSETAPETHSRTGSGPVVHSVAPSSTTREVLAAVRDGQCVSKAARAFELIHPGAQYDARRWQEPHSDGHCRDERPTERHQGAALDAYGAELLDEHSGVFTKKSVEGGPVLEAVAQGRNSTHRTESTPDEETGTQDLLEQTADSNQQDVVGKTPADEHSKPLELTSASGRGPQPLVRGTTVSPWRLQGPIVFEVSPPRRATNEAFGGTPPTPPSTASRTEVAESIDETLARAPEVAPEELKLEAPEPLDPRAVKSETVGPQSPSSEVSHAHDAAPNQNKSAVPELDSPGDDRADVKTGDTELADSQGHAVFAEPEPLVSDPTPAPANLTTSSSGEIDTWKGAATSAAQSITLPDLGPAQRRVGGITGHADATIAAGEEQRAELPKEAQAVLKATQRDVSELGAVSEELLASDTTGVVKRVKDSAKTGGLPPQKLPRLQATPNGNVPNLYGDPITPSDIDKLRKDYQLPTGSHIPDDAELAKLEAAMAQDVELQGRVAVFAGQEISGFELPPKLEVEPVHQQDIAAVLARVITGSEGQAKSTVEAARKAAYANDSLPEAFPTLGEEWLPEEQTFLRGEMQRIAEAAGIAKETLDAEVTKRQEELATQGVKTQETGDKSFEEAKEKVTTDFGKTQSVIESLRQEWEDYADQRAAALNGKCDYKAIRAKQKELETAVCDIAAEWIVAYDDMKKQRSSNLGRAVNEQRKAYVAAIAQDKEDDRAQAEGDQDRLDAIDQDKKYDAWVEARMKVVNEQMADFIKANDDSVQQWQTQMREERDDAVVELRDWADKQIGRERGFFERILTWITAWSQEQKSEAKAFAKQRAGEHVAALGASLTELNQLRLQFGETMSEDIKTRRDTLGDEQRAVVDAYYAEGGGDTVGALAAGLKVRLLKQRAPELTKAMKGAVLAKATNDGANAAGFEKLSKMGFEVDARAIAIACKEGFNHTWGTDEAKIFGALEKVPSQEVGKAVRAVYWAITGQDFDSRLKSELAGGMFDDDEEYDRAKAQLEANKVDAAAAELRIAVEGLGTDEAAIKKVLRQFQKPGEGAPDIKAIVAAYKRMYGEDLFRRLNSELSGTDFEVSVALLAENEEKADAIELKAAQTTWTGPNKEDIETVYQRVHDEEWARGKQLKLSSVEIEKRIRARLDKTSTEYAKENKGKTLKEDFQKMPSNLANLAVGLQDQDWKAVDAARFEIERNGLGTYTDPQGRKYVTGAPLYADDDVINQKILGAQYDRAYEKRQWDLELEVRNQEENWRKTHDRPWTPEERKRRLSAANAKASEEAKKDAAKSMAAFKDHFMRTYEPNRAPSDFDSIVYSVTQGTGEEEARERLLRGGYLPPELHIEYATKGAGTDEERLKGQLHGKTKAEIDVIRKAWMKRHPGEDFDAMILGELSGRERFDVEMMLKHGEPQNPIEALALAKEKLAYEARTGGIRSHRNPHTGEFVTYKTDIFQDLEGQVAALEADAAAWRDARAKYPTTTVEDEQLGKVETRDPNMSRYDAAWNATFQGVKDVVELHRQSVDADADLISTIVATVVAITLAAVLAPFTAGASLGVLAAVAATVGAASTAAMIVVKMSIKGDAYSNEDLAVDLAFGVVDMAVSAVTAGVGGKLMRAAIAAKMATQQGGKAASKEAVKQAVKQASKRTGKQAASNVAHDAAQGLFGNLAVPAVMDEYGRDLNPVLSTALGLGLGMGGGIAMSKAIRGMGKLVPKRPGRMPDVPDLDLVDVRYHPEKLQAMQDAYLEANPGRRADDFLKDYDDLMLKQMKDDNVRAKWEQQARNDMLQHVPEQQRAQFAETPIELMGDKDFKRLTGSQNKGEAVVLLKDGKPTVIVRQGASPTALRREAPHLLQAVDPKWKPHVDLLDEGNLSNWLAKDIREKFQLYNAKLDLELDAGLQELHKVKELARRANPPPGIAQQVADAELTLRNLQRRKDDVAKIGPLERTLMAWGVWPQPRYLDEKPRLFSKRGDPQETRGPPTATPEGVDGPATGKRTIVEPYSGPNLDSAVDLTRQHPDAHVIATEATIHPEATEIRRLTEAGGAFVRDNMPPSIPVGSVDEIKMRFPIPHDRAVQQDFLRHLVDLEKQFPDRPRGELMHEALERAARQAETATAYAPYALQRLKPGGFLEVVFWERQIREELEALQSLRFIDTATGKGYRLELERVEVRLKGDVAPHSGFGVPVTNESPVHVARVRKVELESKLPTGARGVQGEGPIVGPHSGRPYSPESAGGPVRDLDYSKVKFTSKAVDVVERHLKRFDGGGEMELAMLERLRRIVAGELEPTDFDRAFYTHELREYVRYRKLGWEVGQPAHPDASYNLWNDAHTATLEDYKLRERGSKGEMQLFHPDVVAATDPNALTPSRPTGGRGPQSPVTDPTATVHPPRALEHISSKLEAQKLDRRTKAGKAAAALEQEVQLLEGRIKRGELTTDQIIQGTNRIHARMLELGTTHSQLAHLRNANRDAAEWAKEVNERHAPNWGVDPKTGAFDPDRKMCGLAPDQVQAQAQLPEPNGGDTNDAVRRRRRHIVERAPRKPMPMKEWAESGFRANVNRDKSSRHESAALASLGATPNNAAGQRLEFTHTERVNEQGRPAQKGKRRTVVTRPDGTRPNSSGGLDIIEHKHLTGDAPVLHDSQQLRAQRALAKQNSGAFELVISSDENIGRGKPKAKPSATVAHGGPVYYFDLKSGRLTHQWMRDTGNWRAVAP